MFRLKMAQVNNLFDKVYKDTTSKAPQSFQDTVTITPTLQVPRVVMDKLQMMQALGFNVSDYSTVMFLTAYLADRSIQGLIADMEPAEFSQLVSVINGAQPGQFDKQPEKPVVPPKPEEQVEAPGPSDKEVNDNRLVQVLQDLGNKRDKDLELAKQKRLVDPTIQKVDPNDKSSVKVSMRRLIATADPEVVELFGRLLDIGFEIDTRKYGLKVLSKLPPEVSAKALALNDAQWNEAVILAAEGQYSSESNPDVMLHDDSHNNQHKPVTMDQVAPQAPGQPAPAAPLPTYQTSPSGNVSKKDMPKIKQTLVDRYDEWVKAFADAADTIPYGESTGLKIFDPFNGKVQGRKVAMGGSFIFNFSTKQEAMVIGSISGTTQLLVLTLPDGEPEMWDTEAWNPDVVGKNNTVIIQESRHASPRRAQVSDPSGKPVNPGDVIQLQQNNQAGTVLEVMQDGNIVYQDAMGGKALAKPGDQFEVIKNDQNSDTGTQTTTTTPTGTGGAGGPNML